MDMTISHEQGRVPVTVFHLKGKLDATTHEQFEKQAREAFATGARNMLIDLSAVPYISSAGLRSLHMLFTMLRTNAPSESQEAMQKGIREGTFKSPHLKLLKPNANVLEALKLVGYDMYIEIHTDLQKAVASF